MGFQMMYNLKCPLGLREDLLSRLPRLRLLPLGLHLRTPDLELDPFPRGARRASSSEELPPEEPGGLLRSVFVCVYACSDVRLIATSPRICML